jgi:hypothetical protein
MPPKRRFLHSHNNFWPRRPVARQSIDSNSIDNCAIVSVTPPFLTIPKQNLDHATSAAPENLKMESEPL